MATQCECGNPKGYRATACKRCVFLDGAAASHRLLISFMRERVRVATQEVAACLGFAPETASRMLNRLVRLGRAHRDLLDGELADEATYYLTSPKALA